MIFKGKRCLASHWPWSRQHHHWQGQSVEETILKKVPWNIFFVLKGFVYRNLVYQSLCRGGSETLSDHPPGCVLQKAAFSLQCHTEANRPKSMGLLLRMGWVRHPTWMLQQMIKVLRGRSWRTPSTLGQTRMGCESCTGPPGGSSCPIRI